MRSATTKTRRTQRRLQESDFLSVIKFENNIPSVLGTIKNAQKQVRFAGSLAVNDTVKQVQQFTVGTLLPDKFTLRAKGAPWQKPGGKFGFNIRPFSTPGTLTATIGSQANWLKLQEEGGTKSAGLHRLAIPAADYKPKDQVMERHLKPKAILANIKKLESKLSSLKGTKFSKYEIRKTKQELRTARTALSLSGSKGGGDPFIATMPSGLVGIFKRTTTKRLPLKLLFAFKKSAKVNARLEYEKTGSEMADKAFGGHFAKRFARAIATAK